MDDIFTQDSTLTEDVLRQAVRSEELPSPSESSLAFIRNFARNFCICNCIEGRAQELLLN